MVQKVSWWVHNDKSCVWNDTCSEQLGVQFVRGKDWLPPVWTYFKVYLSDALGDQEKCQFSSLSLNSWSFCVIHLLILYQKYLASPVGKMKFIFHSFTCFSFILSLCLQQKSIFSLILIPVYQLIVFWLQSIKENLLNVLSLSQTQQASPGTH